MPTEIYWSGMRICWRRVCCHAFVVLAALWYTSAALAVDDPVAAALARSFIWAAPEIAPPGQQVYVAFRKTFDLHERPCDARLAIFADTRYLVWVNGQFVERGPCRFDPKRPEYDSLDVTSLLKPGRNAIAILVHSYAIGSFTQWYEQCARMMDHSPGLTSQLDVTLPGGEKRCIPTDSTWKLNGRTRFRPSPGTWSSVPDNIDARLDDGDWTAAEYDDASWAAAAPIDGGAWGPIHARSIPLLRQVVLDPPTLLEPASATTPLELKAGQQAIYDLGRTAQAFEVLDFDADEGSAIELLHCAQYRDTGNKPTAASFTGDRFRDRYIARAGRQTYRTGDTWGGRYVVLAVRSGCIRLHHIEAIERVYPFTCSGSFRSSDTVLNKIWEVGVRTVEVCSEDAHVDCADRERAQWMADGYMMGWPVARVALAGPGSDPQHPHYADSRLMRNMLRHTAMSQLPDGRLQPMRPSSYPPNLVHGVIDDYSCLWVQAVRDYYDVTGDAAFLGEAWPVVVKTLDYFLDRRTDRGLVRAMEFVYFKNPLIYQVCEGASINCYIQRSLKDGAYLAGLIRDKAAADRLSSAAAELSLAINEHLWDDAAGSYHGAILDGNKTAPTGHAAAIALFHDIVPAERRPRVAAFMSANLEKEEAFPYTYRYLFEAMYRQATPEADRRVLEIMRRRWAPMTQYETGAASENWHSDSFVHESGAHPAYFLSAYVLGVRTEGARAARRLVIEPRLGDVRQAEGVVLCEYGPVSVAWEKSDDEKTLLFAVEVPPGVAAIAHIPRMSDKTSLIIDESNAVTNGVVAMDGVRLEARYSVVELGPGKHWGKSW